MLFDKQLEQARRLSNQAEFEKIGYDIIKQFCEEREITFQHTERTEIDYDGVDYIINLSGDSINCAFRVIKSNKKMLFLRYSGGEGGVSEAQKIKEGTTKAQVYATYEMSTRMLRFYKITDIKKWLNQSRELKYGKDGSRYYEIPFNDLQPLREFQM